MNNQWLKLAGISFVGVIAILLLMWGTRAFTGYNCNGNIGYAEPRYTGYQNDAWGFRQEAAYPQSSPYNMSMPNSMMNRNPAYDGRQMQPGNMRFPQYQAGISGRGMPDSMQDMNGMAGMMNDPQHVNGMTGGMGGAAGMQGNNQSGGMGMK